MLRETKGALQHETLMNNINEIAKMSIDMKTHAGVGVLLVADSQSTSASGYRASLCDP
jgi:hypothetical protein